MLEIKNLSKIYKSKGNVVTKALDNVSIKFPEKGMVFLLGKSGSGKSTLLNLCGGLDTPDTGEIIVKGRSSNTFSGSDFDSYRNTFIGFVFQEYNILNEFSVEDNIALALELQGKSKDKTKIHELLKQVELENYAKRKPNTLSGGQKQRIAIARALIKDPEIIMADEPTGALDSNTGKQVLETLKKLSETKLVIVVSHDREFAEIYGDRIIELKDGQVLLDVTKNHLEAKQIGNITMIDNHTISIKSGQELSSDDINTLNDFIKKSDKEVLISNHEKDIKGYKEQARISDNGSREAFNDTDNEGIVLKEYTAEESKLIRSKLPLRHAAKIGTSSLKLKPIRLLFTILLSVVAFVLLGVVSTMMFYNKIDVAVNSFVNSDIEYLSIGKSYDAVVTNEDYDYSYKNTYNVNLSDSDIERIKEKYGNQTIFYYDFSKQTSIGQYSDMYLNLQNVNYSNNDSYYSTSIIGFAAIDTNHTLRSKIIDGEYPTKDDEIMISSFTYDSIKAFGMRNDSNQPININSYKDINVLNINGSEYKITGVYSVEEFIPQAYKELLNDSSDNNLEYKWSNEINNGIYTLLLVSDGFYNANKYKFSNNIPSYYTEASIDFGNSNYSFNSLGKKDDYELYNLDGTDYTTSNNKDIYVRPYVLSSLIEQYRYNGANNSQYDDFNKNIQYPIDNSYINDFNLYIYNLGVKDSFTLRNKNGSIVKSSNNDAYVSSLVLRDLAYEEYYDNPELMDYLSYENEISFDEMLNIFAYGLDYNSKEYTESERLEYWDIIIDAFDKYNIDIFDVYNFSFGDKVASLNIAGFVLNGEYTLYCNEDMFKEYYNSDSYSAPWEYEYEFGTKDQMSISNKLSAFNSGEYYDYDKQMYVALSYEERLNYWNDIYSFFDQYGLIEDIFGRITMNQPDYSGSTDVNIKGFVLDGYADLIVSDELFDDIYYVEYSYQDTYTTSYKIDKNAIMSGAFIYNTKDDSQIRQLMNEVYSVNDDDSKLSIYCDVMDSLEMVNSFLSNMTLVFLWVGVVIAVFATLLLFNFISMSITNKKKEIGILRAVGARGLDVFKIFFSESIVIVAICFAISIIGNIVVCNIINIQMGEGLSGVKLLVFGPQSILLILGISILVSFISTFLPVYTIAKKKPVESIRAL